MREEYITYDLAVRAYGCEPDITKDDERAAFFAVWALLIVELDEAIYLEQNKN